MTASDLASMPVAEKIQLLETLWDSLSRDNASSEVIPDWHAEVLAKRIAALNQGDPPVNAILGTQGKPS